MPPKKGHQSEQYSAKASNEAPSKVEILQQRKLMRNGRPIIRLPTTTTWTGPIAGRRKKQQGTFDPFEQPFIEVFTDEQEDEDFSEYDRMTIEMNENYDSTPDYTLTADDQAFLESFYKNIEETRERRKRRAEEKKANAQNGTSKQTNDPEYLAKLQKRRERAREYKRRQTAALSKIETEEERALRLEKQRERQRRFYSKETPEQKARRLEKVRQYQQLRKRLNR